MDYNKIKFATLEVFEKFNIQSFPIDCTAILEGYGLKVKPYALQKPKKKEICLSYSQDSFILKDTVYYNDEKIIGRVRFSLAHEIGHIALKHKKQKTPIQEKEADYFASCLLAPRMAIHYSGCKNLTDVSKLFNMTNEAAQYAYDDFRRWRRHAIYKMDGFDKAMYSHFYNDAYNGFVYSKKNCQLCGKELLNDNSRYCTSCFNRLSFVEYSKNNHNFYIAQDNWLYGGIH